MTPNPLRLPDAVIRRARNHGLDGEAWLENLPALVEMLATDWRIRTGRTLVGGTAGYVAEAVTDDGTEAVLKVKFPGEDPTRAELRTLLEADGCGYARLLRFDRAHDAMLLERLGRPLDASGLAAGVQIELCATALVQAWRRRVDPSGFMDGAGKAEWLAGLIVDLQQALERPCSDRLFEVVRRCLDQRARAFDPAACVLAHGDPHPANALLVPGAAGPQVRFVDPEGLFIEPAYDLGVLMREWDDALLVGDVVANGVERCVLLARLTGVPARPIWEWGLIERVSSGLFVTQLGMPTWLAHCS